MILNVLIFSIPFYIIGKSPSFFKIEKALSSLNI